jgi:hypothetical protein
VTRYTPHADHPLLPNLAARLALQIKLPGVCIHIMGILKLPTLFSLYVVKICGKY